MMNYFNFCKFNGILYFLCLWKIAFLHINSSCFVGFFVFSQYFKDVVPLSSLIFFMETLLTFLSLFLSTYHVFLSLTAFKFFSIFLFLSNLIMLCLGAVVFMFCVLDVYELLRSAGLLFSSNVGEKCPLCLHMVLVLSFFPRRISIPA